MINIDKTDLAEILNYVLGGLYNIPDSKNIEDKIMGEVSLKENWAENNKTKPEWTAKEIMDREA